MRCPDEAFRVPAARLIEGDLTGCLNGSDLTVVPLIQCHEADPGMVMVLVVLAPFGSGACMAHRPRQDRRYSAQEERAVIPQRPSFRVTIYSDR